MGIGAWRGRMVSREGGCRKAPVKLKRAEEGVLPCVGNDFPLALAWTWLVIFWKAELC